jgi:hypothetical protein
MVLFGLLSVKALGQSKPQPLTDASGFEPAYSMSFIIYDTCGDSEAGHILRSAILEKLDRCPYSSEAKAEFQTWRVEELESMVSGLMKPGFK